jgi:hypothetical protein
MVTSIVATRVKQGVPGRRVISSGRATCVAGADERERGEEGAREAGCELRTERVPEKAAAVEPLAYTVTSQLTLSITIPAASRYFAIAAPH